MLLFIKWDQMRSSLEDVIHLPNPPRSAAKPHLRHQSSPEDLMDLSALSETQDTATRLRATHIFNRIINYLIEHSVFSFPVLKESRKRILVHWAYFLVSFLPRMKIRHRSGTTHKNVDALSRYPTLPETTEPGIEESTTLQQPGLKNPTPQKCLILGELPLLRSIE